MFSGSEVNVYELSRYFLDKGNNVDIYCFEKKPLLSDLIEKNGILVYTDIDKISKNYDLIWCQHSSVLSYVLDSGVSADRIIFSSLSFFETFEFAPSYANQLSLCLANSKETYDSLINQGVSCDKILIFPNSVDFNYFNKKNKNDKLKKIICVSNHPPQELIDLEKLFDNVGIQIDFYGFGKSAFELITQDILLKYDGVISIGKTVQYAMALSIPVYCYDHFGGPGWLCSSNLEAAFSKNFSGRGFVKKSSDEIFREIFYNFKNAVNETVTNYEFCYNNCNLDKNINLTLTNLPIVENISSFEVSSKLFKRVFDYWRIPVSIELQNKDQELQNTKQELQNKELELNSLIKSTSWKLTAPLRNFKNKLKYLILNT